MAKQAKDETILSAILDAVKDLYEEHTDEIVNVRNNDTTKTIDVNFTANIDCSGEKPVVKTEIEFKSVRKFKDERTATIDDKQGKFEVLEREGRGGRAKDEPNASDTGSGE